METVTMKKVETPKVRAPTVPNTKSKTRYYFQIGENGGQATVNINLANPKRMILGNECSLVMEVTCEYADGSSLTANVGPAVSMADILLDQIDLEVKGKRFTYMNGGICNHFLNHWLIPNFVRNGLGKLQYFLTEDSKFAETKAAYATGKDANIWYPLWDPTKDNKIRLVRNLGDLPLFGNGDQMLSGLIPMNFHVRTADSGLWQRALRGNADTTQPYKISIKRMYIEIVSVEVIDEFSNQIISEISQNAYSLDTYVNQLQVLNSGNVQPGQQTYQGTANFTKVPDQAYLLFLDLSASQNNNTPYKQEYIYQARFDNLDKVTITSGGKQLAMYEDIELSSNKLKLLEDMSFSTNKLGYFRGGESCNGNVFVVENLISCVPVIFENLEEGFDSSIPMELTFEVMFKNGASKALKPMLLTRTKNNIVLGSGMDNIMQK